MAGKQTKDKRKTKARNESGKGITSSDSFSTIPFDQDLSHTEQIDAICQAMSVNKKGHFVLTNSPTYPKNPLSRVYEILPKTANAEAVLYLRVSTDEQAEKAGSLPTQLHHALRMCEAQQVPVVEVFFEASSACTGEQPMLELALDGIHDNPGRVLVVSELDRFMRNLIPGLTRLERLGKSESGLLYSTQRGSQIVRTANYDMIHNEAGLLTDFHSAAKSARNQKAKGAAGILNSLREGKLITSKQIVPFLHTLTPIPSKRGTHVRKIDPQPDIDIRVGRILNATNNFDERTTLQEFRCALANVGPKLNPRDFHEELEYGWAFSLNRSKPDRKNSVEARCERLGTKLGEAERLRLYDVNNLLHALLQPKPKETSKVTPEEIAPLNHLFRQTGKKLEVGFVCSNNHPRALMDWVGNGPEELGPDYYRCPVCYPPKSGSPGKALLPALSIYSLFRKGPLTACEDCGKIDRLSRGASSSIGSIVTPIYVCRRCNNSTASFGAPHRRENPPTIENGFHESYWRDSRLPVEESLPPAVVAPQSSIAPRKSSKPLRKGRVQRQTQIPAQRKLGDESIPGSASAS